MNTENNQRVTRQMSRSETIRLENNKRVTRSHVAKDGTSGSRPNTENQNLEKAKKRKRNSELVALKGDLNMKNYTACELRAIARERKVPHYTIYKKLELARMLGIDSVAGSSKKMENMIDTTDRISTLPDFIVHHILSYLLDDYESRVRMSVVSKKWFALTTSFPLLYFHLDLHWPWPYPEFDNDSLYRVEMFYRYLEYTVSRFCDQNDVSAHTLDFFANFVDLGQIQLFGRCLELVVEKDLQMCWDMSTS
ncbi:F-box domain containing protein [Tanacetum coccineum]|uniref:F-box domain containing protein n=1 Tax=Tanacetum coccineum TaxID=301880 RepID=A0ABQ5A347_9ASTR